MSEAVVTLNTICSMDLLHAHPTDAALSVLHRMRKSHVSSIVIVDRQAPLGIITEKDILSLVSQADRDLTELTAADIMTSPVKTMYGDDDFQHAYEEMQRENVRHIVVINRDGSVRGIATETDFVQHLGFEYLSEIKHVEAVMERSILFVPPDCSLRKAFTVMSEEKTSSVVVGDGLNAMGILTERDVVRLLDDQIDLNNSQVCDYMSSPVATIDIGTSLLDARQMMQAMGIRRLLVADADGKVIGLLTRQHLIDRLQTHFIQMMRDAIDSLNKQLNNSRDKAIHYQGFFENSPMAYQSLDADGNIIEVNACWRALMGYESWEVIGTPFKKLLAPGQEDQFDHCFSSFNINGYVKNIHYQLETKTGDKVEVQLDGQIIFDEAHNFLQTQCLLTNLTEKYKTDSQLRLFRQLIDHSNDALFVIDAETSRILDINQATCNYLGYEREQLLQMSVTDISDQSHDPDSWHQRISLVGEKGGMFEATHTTSDGRKVPVEISAVLQSVNGMQVVLSTARDITERKQAEQRVREESNFLQAVIDCIGDPVMVIGTDYKVMRSNRAADDYSFNCLQHHEKPCYKVAHDSDGPCPECPLTDVVASKKTFTRIHEYTNKSGETRTFELMASPLYDAHGQVTGLVQSSRDITDHIKTRQTLVEKEKSLDFLAHHDPLTKLPNRLLFGDRLEQALRHAKRNNTGVALLFIDLDEFKEINDSFGHNLGDQLLQKVSERLKKHVRDNDTISRLGGDEFTIIVEDIANSNDAARVAQTLLNVFNQPIELDEQLHISLSIGISLYPDDADQPEALIRNADTAMYRAKAAGKNRYEFYTQEMTDQAFERILIIGALRNAIEHEQFVLHYQPQIDLRDNRIIGAEALIRWKDPQMGTIEPARFIPIAEKTGMIRMIDHWVLDTVCRNISAWQQQGYQVPRISINISARHFGSNSLAAEVAGILDHNRCSSEMIELEITEGVIMNNPERAGKELKQLREMGIRLAIDDFGTGYSSLSYLKTLPLDRLKIDHSFIRDITDDMNDQAISRAIIALADSLGLEVIAEGMETREQRQFLIDENCFYAQGFLFSKGIPEDAFLSLLDKA